MYGFVAFLPTGGLARSTNGHKSSVLHSRSFATGARPSFMQRAIVHDASVRSEPIRTNGTMQMISPETARLAIAVYGVLVAGGGIGAFLKSGSKPSIISGVAAGIVLAGAYVKESVPLALGTAVVLTIVFSVRLAKTKKFIPAGMLCILSVVAAAFFAASIYA